MFLKELYNPPHKTVPLICQLYICYHSYSLRPFLIVACASQKTTTVNYILKHINIYNT